MNEVEKLLNICKNLTEEDIIDVIQNYSDELIRDKSSETNYIEYQGNLYKLNPTIRKANNKWNLTQINPNKNKNNAEEDNAFRSHVYRDFFKQKFNNSKQIKYVHIDYYWVCQSNYESEKEQSILYSRATTGAHKKMRALKPYDTVISYDSKSQKIRAIIVVQEFPIINEDEDYIEVKVKYEELPNPISKEIIHKNFSEDKRLLETNFPFQYRSGRFECKLGYLWLFTSQAYQKIIGNKLDITKVEVNNTQDKNEGNKNMKTKQPLNQILYGPPGTGKTYNTVIKAMEIIKEEKLTDDNGNLLDGYDYKTLKEHFDKYKEQGQIQFITFHQSYSYEEFVEGIKPNLAFDNLTYKLESGIFKKICKNATNTTADNFDEAYKKLIDEIQKHCVENETEYLILQTNKNQSSFGIALNSNGNLNLYTGKNFKQQGSLIKERLHDMSDWKYYAKPILEYMKTNCEYKTVSKKENENYVLIIDEINRGNISKIFGELITLIEKDKRAGEDNAMTITLPYSGEPFSVPNNLYIIGTMNTADKSLTLLDVALRRRFEFVPIYPQPELIDDTYSEQENKKAFLENINKIILDNKKSPDYLIGHAYFMNNYSLVDILNKKIIPLLMEYYNGKQEVVKKLLDDVAGDKYKTKTENYYLQVE